MLINIMPEYTEVSIEKNGLISKKLVNLSDFLDELSSHRSTNFGMLPRGVRICESRGSFLVIGVEFPKQTRSVVYKTGYMSEEESQTFEKASLPGGLLLVKLYKESDKEFKVGNSYIYAMSGNRLQFDTDRLYNYPMPNVYPDGKICWGTVNLGTISSISAVEGMISSFFANNFNNDLFSSSIKTTERCPFHDVAGVADYFTALSANEFSDEWLVESQYRVREIASVLLKTQ